MQPSQHNAVKTEPVAVKLEKVQIPLSVCFKRIDHPKRVRDLDSSDDDETPLADNE